MTVNFKLSVTYVRFVIHTFLNTILALGEPLIKGLTEVAQLRPKNPVVHLANYLLSYDGQEDVGKVRKVIRFTIVTKHS